MTPSKPPISNLTDHRGYWLRVASNAVSQPFARVIAAEGVTVAEWTVLRTLYDVDAIAPSALAEQMGLTRGAISKLADRLIAKQLIERSDDPDDRRTHTLSLTKAGRKKVPALAKLADCNDAAAFEVLTPKERDQLTKLLTAFAQRRGLTAPPMS